MLGDTVGISKVLETKNLEKSSLSYHEMRLMGKGGVSVGGVVCFHALGLHGLICQELHQTWFLAASAIHRWMCEMPGHQPCMLPFYFWNARAETGLWF